MSGGMFAERANVQEPVDWIAYTIGMKNTEQLPIEKIPS